jgi:oligopeptide/dipeptide ABC transporter ATP-binding protein
MKDSLLTVDDLRVTLATTGGPVYPVAGVSLDVRQREFVGIVGESGSGKTTLALAILRLLAPGSTVSGAVRFDGTDLLGAPPKALRQIRSRQIGYVPQDPLTALDPTFSVGEQIAETIRAHRQVSRRDARSEAIELMERVGIPEPDRKYRDPVHRLSGGMRQRIAIAIAIANSPRLIVADEPTTALDVTIQAQILKLLADLAQESGTSVLVITHDLAVVSETCDRLAVMYAGTIVENGPVDAVFANPQHPYTQALLGSLPSSASERGLLPVILGEVPTLREIASGCPFAPRCPQRIGLCDSRPSLQPVGTHWQASCWRTNKSANGQDPDGQHVAGAAS